MAAVRRLRAIKNKLIIVQELVASGALPEHRRAEAEAWVRLWNALP